MRKGFSTVPWMPGSIYLYLKNTDLPYPLLLLNPFRSTNAQQGRYLLGAFPMSPSSLTDTTMRSSLLLFILAALAISGLLYQTMRPSKLTPDTERLIREAVQEAVAMEFREYAATLSETQSEAALVDEDELKAYFQRIIRTALAEEAKAREAHAATLSPGDDALRAVDLEAERRHQMLKKANADALVVDALRIASNVQAWKLKPRAFGGGSNQAGFEGIRFEQLGYQDDETGSYTNLNGVFALVAESDTAYVFGTNVNFNNKVVVTIRGTRPGDISTSIQNLDRDL